MLGFWTFKYLLFNHEIIFNLLQSETDRFFLKWKVIYSFSQLVPLIIFPGHHWQSVFMGTTSKVAAQRNWESFQNFMQSCYLKKDPVRATSSVKMYSTWSNLIFLCEWYTYESADLATGQRIWTYALSWAFSWLLNSSWFMLTLNSPDVRADAETTTSSSPLMKDAPVSPLLKEVTKGHWSSFPSYLEDPSGSDI